MKIIDNSDGTVTDQSTNLMDWWPIETAPKNGTVFGVPQDSGYTRAFWQDGLWWWYNTEMDSLTAGPEPKGWRPLTLQPCTSREEPEMKPDLMGDQSRIVSLEQIIERQQFIEDRYTELHLAARRCWRYYGVNLEMFDASMEALDALIQRHNREIDEMEEKE